MVMSVLNVYFYVVEDVINNVCIDFQSEGVDDNVFNEFQLVRIFCYFFQVFYIFLLLFWRFLMYKNLEFGIYLLVVVGCLYFVCLYFWDLFFLLFQFVEVGILIS